MNLIATRLQHARTTARVLLKNGLTATKPGRDALLPRYRFCFEPDQLWAICEAAERTVGLGGAVAEVGVWVGDTTVFLNRHLQSVGESPLYHCIDTFDGFTSDDVAEERSRGKREDYSNWFRMNSRAMFERTVEHNQLTNVRVIEADACTFDYASLGPLSFALIDVDLRRPMRAALEGCWSRLLPGGILIADDCQSYEHLWDGARDAYEDFCSDHGLATDVRNGKLGFIQKPADADPPAPASA